MWQSLKKSTKRHKKTQNQRNGKHELPNWTRQLQQAQGQHRKANPPPVQKLLSGIANFNLLEKYRARHQQILIHNQQWRQRRDDDNNHDQHNIRLRHQHKHIEMRSTDATWNKACQKLRSKKQYNPKPCLNSQLMCQHRKVNRHKHWQASQ